MAVRRPFSACVQGTATRGEVERLREKPGTGKGLGARRGRGTQPAASAFGVDGVTGKNREGDGVRANS